jgi:hypothetical protein
MIFTSGQAWRSRPTSSLITAAAFLAPSMRLRLKTHASMAWPQNTYSGK